MEYKWYMFPFEKVAPGEKIVIYGAGKAGQCYLQQIEKTKYCDVVCVVDKAHDCYPPLNVPVCLPSELLNYTYDKILIAVNDHQAAVEIKQSLVREFLLDETTVICAGDRLLIPKFQEPLKYAGTELAYKKKALSLAFFIGGGLGDCIIAKRVIEEIVGLAQSDYSIDLFGHSKNLLYIKSIFHGFDFLNNIIDGPGIYQKAHKNYALAIKIGYFLSIDSLKLEIVSEEHMELANTIIALQVRIKNSGLDIDKATDNGLHFAQCKLKGKNCYTTYGYDGVFPITDSHVAIPLIPEYLLRFSALGFKKYITINFGWGERPNEQNSVPNKVWPISYYEKLVELLKHKFPTVTIVQLGLGSSPQIKGADQYIFGESIELSKYILKNSLLHIDCEGGLVHLATQLGTKCVVLFGPTPVHYFGYKENINIVSDICSNCYYLVNDFSTCIRNLARPECMYSITPDIVMEKVEEYFSEKFTACSDHS